MVYLKSWGFVCISIYSVRGETQTLIEDEAAYRDYFNGNEKAADGLIKKYGDSLVFYINGYIKDIHESEDLMIEAFSNMFVKKRPVTESGSFKAYLYKIAHNLAIRHNRKYKIPFVHLDELTFEPQSSEFADTALFHNERNQKLYDALGKLKKEYREALYLIYFEDMSYRDASVVMGKSEAQITKLIYRGKQNLKVLLKEEGINYADI